MRVNMDTVRCEIVERLVELLAGAILKNKSRVESGGPDRAADGEEDRETLASLLWLSRRSGSLSRIGAALSGSMVERLLGLLDSEVPVDPANEGPTSARRTRAFLRFLLAKTRETQSIPTPERDHDEVLCNGFGLRVDQSPG